MTRRLVLAILSTVIAAIVLTGLGTFLLSAAASKRADERALRSATLKLANSTDDLDPAAIQRTVLNDNIRKILSVDGIAFVRVAANGRVNGELPPGVTAKDIAAARADDGVTVSGRRAKYVWAATSAKLGQGSRFIVIATRRVSNGFASAFRWFVLSSVLVVALGALVALTLGRRLTKPVRDAEAAAHRIAAGELSTRLVDDGGDDALSDLARSVNSMAASLERSKSVEQQFLMSVSHDLRTPLTSIRGYAEAITDGAAPDPAWAAGVITSEAKRLERLVGDLLDLAKLQARSFAMNPRRVDLAGLATEVAHGLAADTPDVTITAPSSTPVMVHVDPDRMAQVIGNLITNAKKYARSTVSVGAGSDGSNAVLWVDDDGPGIPAAERQHVFERLYVTSQPAARHESSSGLGLAIVHELVTAMGGTVRVDSAPTDGARFVVTVPLAP
jgi:two-component system, OmpR family, sensor kinase